MKSVAIGYNKIKMSAVLLVLSYLATAPVGLFFVAPNLFSFAGKSFATIAITYGLILGGSLIGVSLIALKLKKYSDAEEGILVYRDGLWSNVSGLSETFIPWQDVKRAYVPRSSGHFSTVVIEKRSNEEEHEQRPALSRLFKRKPGIVVWPITLSLSATDLAEMVNDYALQYHQLQTQQPEHELDTEELAQRAA